MSDFNIEEFVENPSVAALESGLKKADWICLAETYAVTIKRSWKKALIVSAVVEYLVDSDVLGSAALKLCEGKDISDAVILKELELEKVVREHELQKDQYKREREREAHELLLLEKKAALGINEDSRNKFDIFKCIKLVPIFDESDPDEFFTQFEKLAVGFEWPEEKWSILIQHNLTGKGRSTYNSILSEQQSDYNFVKRAILDSYEVTAEYYRVKSKSLIKEYNSNFTE